MANIPISKDPKFNTEVRQFETEDYGHADLFNAVVEVLVNNDAFLQMTAAHLAETILTHVQDTDNPHDLQSKLDIYYQQLTAYADKAVSDLVGTAPEALDTIEELAEAYENNKDVVDALNEAIGKKANKNEIPTSLPANGGTADSAKNITMQVYERFADIPLPSNNFFSCVVLYDGSDPDAPVKTEGPWWWNVIIFGQYSRDTQIAFCPYRNKGHIYVNQNHDGNWSGWYDISSEGGGNADTFDVHSALALRTINQEGNEYGGIFNLMCQYSKFGDSSFGLFINNLIDNHYYPIRTDISTRAIYDNIGNIIHNTYLKKICDIEDGLSFRYSSDGSPITFGNVSTGWGGRTLYDGGLICADNIDPGIMLYMTKGASSSHDFHSFNYSGVQTGMTSIANGYVYTSHNFQAGGGDYAEYWEYTDGNVDNEDRTGLFVTFAGKKIRIAQKGDNLAKVGVVSATPSIVGDSDGKEWKHKYRKDVFGREILEDVEYEDEESGDTITVKERVLNPDYDEKEKYIKRADRPEWDAVGTHGKLVVRDDETCQPDGFCVPTDGGIATASEDGFYVMERLDDSHVRIYIR